MPKKLKQSIYGTDHASPGLLFWRAFFNWQKLIREGLEPHDLTQGQYAVLAAVSYLSSDRSAVSQQDVARQLAMDKMMVSDIVKSLARKEFLSKKSHPEDARAFALSVTSSGKAVLKKCVPIVESVDEEFFRATGTHFPEFRESLKILARTN